MFVNCFVFLVDCSDEGFVVELLLAWLLVDMVFVELRTIVDIWVGVVVVAVDLLYLVVVGGGIIYVFGRNEFLVLE